MKPFDIELAKEGYPICTKDGRKVRIVCFNRKDEYFPIVALVQNFNHPSESIYSYAINGRRSSISDHITCDDLMMVSSTNDYSNSHFNDCVKESETKENTIVKWLKILFLPGRPIIY